MTTLYPFGQWAYSVSDPEFLAGFTKRKAISYSSAQPSEDLTDFPKLFKISSDSDIAAELSSGGGISITGPDGLTEVPFGLYPSSDLSSGDIILRAKLNLRKASTQLRVFGSWFNPAESFSSVDILGYIYYDSAHTTVEDKAGVLSNYPLFMPLEEDPSGSAPQMFDWVSESNLGTSGGSMTSGDLVASQVGNGIDVDGNDFISVPHNAAYDLAAPFTISFWLKYSANTNRVLIEKNGNSGFSVQVSETGASLTLGGIKVNIGGTTIGTNTTVTASAWNDGAWHKCDVVIFGVGSSQGKIFIDGVDNTHVTTNDCGTPSYGSSTPVYIGSRNGSFGFVGLMDEIGISSVARSANWIAYQYQDEFNNSNTFTLSAEQSSGGGGGGTNRRRRVLICGASA